MKRGKTTQGRSRGGLGGFDPTSDIYHRDPTILIQFDQAIALRNKGFHEKLPKSLLAALVVVGFDQMNVIPGGVQVQVRHARENKMNATNT